MKKEIEGFLKCLKRRTVQVTAVSYIYWFDNLVFKPAFR